MEPHPQDTLTPGPGEADAAHQSLPSRRAVALHRLCDHLTGWLLYFMVVFSPWAFGTTQAWSVRVMNVSGCVLGFLLILKWVIRLAFGWQPERWTNRTIDGPAVRRPGAGQGSQVARLLTAVLAVLTFLIPAYCLVSALNARASYRGEGPTFEYYDCLTWLPHSYDAAATWAAFWTCLALSFDFWAIRDWLLTLSQRDALRVSPLRREEALAPGFLAPRRLRRLLWVLSVSGGLLAAQGIAQRLFESNKLLWLVEPRINNTFEAQFGPYAYRSSAAQYFLLAWPLAFGLWWLLRSRASSTPPRKETHNNLLPCVFLMALVPLMSLSRAGAVIGVVSIVVGMFLLFKVGRVARGRSALGMVGLLALAFFLGAYLEWPRLVGRFGDAASDSGRYLIWQDTWKMVRDFPLFGAGPRSFGSVFELYWSSPESYGAAHVHNDWLESIATFGVVGSGIIWSALLLALARPATTGGLHLHRLFVLLVYLAMGSCLLYAAGDSPFQIYSVTFLFVLEAALLQCVSLRSPDQ